MKLTQIQIRLVQRSFGRAATKKRLVATLFYDRLFELDSSLRPLFHNADMEEQRHKFMQILALAVSSLNDPKVFQERMETLGKRLLDHGVQREHYTAFGNALLWALEKSMGKEFTPAVREAWRAVCAAIAEAAMDNFYAAAG